MKEKIMNIKNILRIIISLFIIFSMVKSCAKAITYEDIKTYANNTADYFPNNTYYQTIKSNVNKTQFETLINSMDISSYTDFYLTYHKYPTRTEVLFTCFIPNSWIINNNSCNFVGNYKTAYININSNGTGKNDTATYNNGNSVINYAGFYSYTANQENSLLGMIYTSTDLSQTYTLPSTFVGLQGVTPQVNIYFGHLFSTTITYNNEEIEAVTLNYNYRRTFIDNVVTEDNEITSMIATLDNEELAVQDLGDYWTLAENNSTTLKYNQIYTLNVKAIVNGNEEEIEEKVIFVPPGTTISGGVITSMPSGDYGFSTENATNQIIENQDKNNTFWQDTYNSLFVMDSGDVDRLITDMKQNIKIDNFGDVSGEIAILNTLTGEPSDFIIAWNPTQYMGKTIIPSGEINFSQKVREVPALKTTQDWLRIIMGYSITIVLMSEIFFTILRCLGVGVSIYEQHNEEIERLEEMHTPKIYDTEVMTPKGIKRYRTRRTRIQ